MELIYCEDKIVAAFDPEKVTDWTERDAFDASPDGLSGKREGFYFGNWLMPFRPTFMFEGVLFSPTHYPECLNQKTFSCATCNFFTSKNCPLKKDKSNFNLTRKGFKLYTLIVFAPRGGYVDIFDVAHKELKLHGKPLHYQMLTRILSCGYPTQKITDRKLIKVLRANPIFFTDMGEGVYQVVPGVDRGELNTHTISMFNLFEVLDAEVEKIFKQNRVRRSTN